MGPQQLAGVMTIVGRESAASQGREYDEEAARAAAPGDRGADRRASRTRFFMSGKVYDDGIIDPRDTRTVLGIAISAAHNNVVEGRKGFGVFRM